MTDFRKLAVAVLIVAHFVMLGKIMAKLDDLGTIDCQMNGFNLHCD